MAFVFRRIIVALPLLFAVLLAAFLLLYALPGSPVDALLGRNATPEQEARLTKELGLDQPLYVQFGRYAEGVVLRGDLGRSNVDGAKVSDQLCERIPATMELALAAMLIAVIVGVSIGVLTALKPKSWRDMLGLTGALAGVSIPIFWLGVMAQRGLGPDGLLGLPLGGRYDAGAMKLAEAVAHNHAATGFYLYDTLVVFGDWNAFLDVLAHLALPALVLATVPAAVIVRLTRTAIGETMQQDYIRTARAKGLSTGRVVTRHALRNAAIPIVTAAGTQFGYLLGGAVLTETIFSWPGLGSYIVHAIDVRDARPLQGAVLFIAAGFIVVNLLVDMSYAALDPRVRRMGKP